MARGHGGDPRSAYATLYDVFGLRSGATEAAIRSRYRQLVKELHPDATGTTTHAARLIEVNHAWEVLSDPKRRAAYDSEVLGIRSDDDTSLLTAEELDELARKRVERWFGAARGGFRHFFPAPLDWPGGQTLWEMRSYGWWEDEMRRLPKASPYLLRLDAPPDARFEALDHLDRDELILLRSAPMYDVLTADELRHLRGHVALADLQLPHVHVDDAGLAAIGPLPQLRVLNLFGNRLTSASLHVIGSCPSLIELNVGRNPIDDVSALAGLRNLRHLDLRKTDVDESAIESLRGLPALEHLDVDLGWRARRRLRRMFPRVRIV